MTGADGIILFNLFLLESLLSIDNAAVLAVMVRDLPYRQQARALKYGIAGAFVFRGICLLLAAWLVKILWLKIAGGIYLVWLVLNHFRSDTGDDQGARKRPGYINRIQRYIGAFWSTVILVEIMDIAFSIDNIFAAVAMTDNIYLIMAGVFIGILAMRFVAQGFTVLMRRFPSLESSAYIVIFILGLKLILSGMTDYFPVFGILKSIFDDHMFDLGFSCAMIVIFLYPIIKNLLTKRHA